MATAIYIETTPIGNGEFELRQTLTVDGVCKDEREITDVFDDRMIAAITNLGLACKWLIDDNITRGDVTLITDQDGKDVRYGGEHNDLFAAIHSKPEYINNRGKYALFYGKHVTWLDRIRDYADLNEIAFRIGEKDEKITPVVKRNYGGTYYEHRLMKELTRTNITRISMAGASNTIYCTVCGESEKYAQTNEFKPVTATDARGKSFTLKTNKQLVHNFLERHYGKHKDEQKRLGYGA